MEPELTDSGEIVMSPWWRRRCVESLRTMTMPRVSAALHKADPFLRRIDPVHDMLPDYLETGSLLYYCLTVNDTMLTRS